MYCVGVDVRVNVVHEHIGRKEESIVTVFSMWSSNDD